MGCHSARESQEGAGNLMVLVLKIWGAISMFKAENMLYRQSWG
jgi:hypothetical protein